VSLHLIALDCPACGSAMEGDSHDFLFFCSHCGSGALLDDDGLEVIESSALMPAPGYHARVWKPAWVLEVDVVVDERIRDDGRRTQGWRGERSFVIPAFGLPLNDLVTLARALSRAVGTVGEVPREPIRGGTLSLEDALTLSRHIIVGDEVRKPDMLASLRAELELKSHRLAAIPFERDGKRLRCAVTGVTVRRAA
jgi:hypothetical protein